MTAKKISDLIPGAMEEISKRYAEHLLKEIDYCFVEMRNEILRGIAGSKRAERRARVLSSKLGHILKDYRKKTCDFNEGGRDE